MNLLYRWAKIIQIIGISAFILTSLHANASSPVGTTISSPQHTEQIIQKLYSSSLNYNSVSDMSTRLDVISKSFLGSPYLLGALGEGEDARYDQSPLYRMDSFDCQTYVETVLALALARSPDTFKQCLNKIRYANDRIDFLTRNHFTSLDWNPNNQQKGFIKDITNTITSKDANQVKHQVTQIATALIDRASWYQHMGLDTIKLFPSNPEIQQQRLLELKAKTRELPKISASIPYLPLTALFDEQGNPNYDLFSQIPNAAIIEIVRPNWDLSNQIGTHLNVSHLGFAFWKDKTLIFRQASSISSKVIDVPLIDYLNKARTNPTIKGINVQVVVPQIVSSTGCKID